MHLPPATILFLRYVWKVRPRLISLRWRSCDTFVVPFRCTEFPPLPFYWADATERYLRTAVTLPAILVRRFALPGDMPAVCCIHRCRNTITGLYSAVDLVLRWFHSVRTFAARLPGVLCVTPLDRSLPIYVLLFRFRRCDLLPRRSTAATFLPTHTLHHLPPHHLRNRCHTTYCCGFPLLPLFGWFPPRIFCSVATAAVCTVGFISTYHYTPILSVLVLHTPGGDFTFWYSSFSYVLLFCSLPFSLVPTFYTSCSPSVTILHFWILSYFWFLFPFHLLLRSTHYRWFTLPLLDTTIPFLPVCSDLPAVLLPATTRSLPFPRLITPSPFTRYVSHTFMNSYTTDFWAFSYHILQVRFCCLYHVSLRSRSVTYYTTTVPVLDTVPTISGIHTAIPFVYIHCSLGIRRFCHTLTLLRLRYRTSTRSSTCLRFLRFSRSWYRSLPFSVLCRFRSHYRSHWILSCCLHSIYRWVSILVDCSVDYSGDYHSVFWSFTVTTILLGIRWWCSLSYSFCYDAIVCYPFRCSWAFPIDFIYSYYVSVHLILRSGTFRSIHHVTILIR